MVPTLCFKYYDMPKKELKKRYNVSLYPSTVKRIDDVAKESGTTRSDIIEGKFKTWPDSLEGSEKWVFTNDNIAIKNDEFEIAKEFASLSIGIDFDKKEVVKLIGYLKSLL